MWIQAVSYNKYFKIYQPRLADIANNNITPEMLQMGATQTTLQVLTKQSLANMRQQQDIYRQQVVNFNTKAKELNTAAKSVTASDFFTAKQAVSSAQTAVSGQAKSGAQTAQYEISVTRLATAQQNTGSSLSRSGTGILAAGTYAMGLTSQSGKEKTIMVNLGAGLSNAQILDKFAKAVNEVKAGVQAEVKTAGTQSYLALSSTETGQANSFSLHDITGNAVEMLQLGHTVTEASDAAYTLNGKSGTSGKNDLSLDNGNVLLSFQSVTNGSVSVKISADTAKMTEGVQRMVEAYNALGRQLQGSSNATERSTGILAGMAAMLKGPRERSFKEIGLTREADGSRISLDADKLEEALRQNPEKVASLIGGRSGFGALLQNITQTTLTSPVSSYLKQPNPLEGIDYGWRRPGIYNAGGFANQGLFLDMVI